jgi:predicted nucleic acid-binding protein
VYLIDTDVVSELRKGRHMNKGVRKFFRQVEKDQAGIHLSVVTIGELRRGTDLIRYRGDAVQAAALEAWIVMVLDDYSLNVISIDEDVAQMWGRLRVPHPENELDKLIAATAMIHDLSVVTRNVKDFAGTGARIINPFE